MDSIPKTLAKLPDSPGIYLYYDATGQLIYVGKATSLKSRVRSYFAGKRSPRPIEEMIHEVVKIEYRVADSALEAAILESIVIKKYQPRYNVLGKDDKSWNYLVLTNEPFPRLASLRQHEYEVINESISASKKQANKKEKKLYKNIFGPFPGLNTPAALKLLRRMFHYSSCKPGTGRPCLYREIGQCLGVCTGEITPLEYRRRVIKPLTLFLDGHKKQVLSIFRKEMLTASKSENFELARERRDQIKQLERIHDMAILNDSFFKDPVLVLEGPTSVRVEGYDISNTGETEKVGSMVVFGGSGPRKSDYRKFIIKTVAGQSDVDSLKEVLNRRLNHPEWPLPSIFLIDGGLPQVHAAEAVMKERKINIPVVGIAKGPERKRNDFFFGLSHVLYGVPPNVFGSGDILARWVRAHQKLLIAVRDESHRFAITFHRKRLRGRVM